MRTVVLLTAIAAAFLSPAQGLADVNTPGAMPMERPPGPPSAPGVLVNGMPAVTPAPTADPSAPREGRATTAPPPADTREKPERTNRNRSADLPLPATVR